MAKTKEVAAAVESDGRLYVFFVDGHVVTGRLDSDGIAWEKPEEGEEISVPGTAAARGKIPLRWV